MADTAGGGSGKDGDSQVMDLSGTGAEEGDREKTSSEDLDHNMEDPFQRSGMTPRSPAPIQTQDMNLENQPGDSENDQWSTPLTSKRELKQFKKRKYSLIDLSPEQVELRDNTEEVIRRVKELKELVYKIPKTKNVLKNIINEAYEYTIKMESLQSNINKGEAVDSDGDDVTKNTDVVTNQENNQPMCHICKKKIEEQGKSREDIEKEIEKLSLTESKENYIQEVENTIKKKWADNAFKKVQVKKGNPFAEETVKNLLVVKSSLEEKSVLLDVAVSKFPDLQYLLEDKNERFQYLENTTRTSKTAESTRKISLIQANTTEEVIRGLLTVREQNNIKISVAATEKHNWVAMRKLLEVIFHQSESEIEFYIPNRFMKDDKKERNIININIDHKEGQSSEEVIKNMKSKIQIEKYESMGVHIKTIKPLENGNAKVVVMGQNPAGIQELCGQIKSSVSGITSVKIQKGKEKAIRISNIDMATSTDEVTETIREYLDPEKENTHQIRVRSLKPNYRRDAQTAIVSLNEADFKKIVERKKIRMGWIECHLEEVVDPVRCYKCFRHGHYAKDCQMPPFGKNTCFRCNQEGHIAKNCENEAICRDCETVGHQTGSMRCNTYKDLIQKFKHRGTHNINTI
uniref:ATP-dependent RNA helicase glh-4 n=1 Tax=Cacopsylla melanoneura TaxID=428564 RepID=A0A8D9EXP3_9HEMI